MRRQTALFIHDRHAEAVPGAIVGTTRLDLIASNAANAGVAMALVHDARAAPRAIVRAIVKPLYHAAVGRVEAGVAQASAVDETLAVPGAVTRAAADDGRAVMTCSGGRDDVLGRRGVQRWAGRRRGPYEASGDGQARA